MAEQAASVEQAPAAAPAAPQRGPGRAEDPAILDRIVSVLEQDEGPTVDAAPEGAPEPAQGPQAVPAPEGQGQQEQAPEGEQEAPKAEQAAEGGETVEIGTLAELAEHIGVEVADLYNISVPIENEGGGHREVSLAEWKNSYQIGEKAQAQQAELVEMRGRLEREATQAREQISKATMDASAVVDLAERQVMAEMEAVNWNELKADDPAQYAAARQDFNDRQSAIQAAKGQIQQHFQQAQQAQMAELQQQLGAQAAREREALTLALPEWRDESVATTERTALREYLAGNQFTGEEIANAIDHRLIVMARKAMLYDKAQKETKGAKAKLVRIGGSKKVLQPGPKPSRGEAEQDARSSLAAQHKRSGTMDSAAAYLESLDRR